MKGCYELWNKSYILPKEFEIFTVMNAEQSWQYRINFIRCCIFTDIRIFRLRLLNILMCSAKRSERFHPESCISFLTGRGIHWHFGRISLLPIRLCYVGSTFINHSSYQGRLKESTQLGAELIGIDSVEADAEMIAMVVDGLKKVGLKEFQVNIGHVDFLQSLMEATGLSKEQQEEIYNLIANRNFFGVEELLEQADASPELKETFRLLPEFAGDVDVLKKAVEHAPTDQAKQAVGRLLKIYKLLALYGADDYVTFDLSMSGHYGYYTGIVFRAYTYGTGDAIVTGGRYDHLLEKFGKQTPSIGFAIIIDELQNALSRQKITVETGHNNLIVYTDATEKWAIALAKDFREKGKYMELLKRTEEDSKETFIAYGKRTHAVSMLYLNENLTIDMVNLSTGEEKKVNARKKAKARENR